MDVDKIEHWALQWKTGEWIALAKKVGGDAAARALLRDELIVELRQAMFCSPDNGQRLVPPGLKAKTTPPNPVYCVGQPLADYAAPYRRLTSAFEGNLESIESLMALGESGFQTKSEALLQQLRDTPSVANILKAVHLPIVVPQFVVSDYGQAMEETFLPAVGRAYETQFPGRKFHQNLQGSLAGQVSIVEGSRHDVLVERAKEDPVVGIYFPNPLQGWSVDAEREQMENLFEGLLLVGGIDGAIGQIMYPAELARDGKTPLYDLAALQWRSAEYSLYFNPRDAGLAFHNRALLGRAHGHCSGGLLFVG